MITRGLTATRSASARAGPRMRAYNELVTAWSDIERAAADAGILGSQTQLDI